MTTPKTFYNWGTATPTSYAQYLITGEVYSGGSVWPAHSMRHEFDGRDYIYTPEEKQRCKYCSCPQTEYRSTCERCGAPL